MSVFAVTVGRRRSGASAAPKRVTRVQAALACAWAVLLTPSVARAEGHEAWWHYRNFGARDAAIAGTGFAMTAVGTSLAPRPAPLHGGILFDDATRNLLRAKTPRGRAIAARVSDVLLLGEILYPTVIDPVIVTGAGKRQWRSAEQLALVDTEALFVTMGLQSLTSGLTSRARPYTLECGRELDPESHACLRASRFRSFFSGHTAFSFTSAASSCVQHLRLPIYGGGAPDKIACAMAATGAAAAGTLRIVADMHYASDVIAGMVIGTAVGLVVPLVLRAPADDRVAPSPAGGAPPGAIGGPVTPVASFGGTF